MGRSKVAEGERWFPEEEVVALVAEARDLSLFKALMVVKNHLETCVLDSECVEMIFSDLLEVQENLSGWGKRQALPQEEGIRSE